MTTQTRDELLNQIINNIGNIMKDQSSINNAQSEMNSIILEQLNDLKFRVEILEEDFNERLRQETKRHEKLERDECVFRTIKKDQV